MTPFGLRMRELRGKKSVTMRAMADALQVSSPYLSALEHGKRGRPTIGLIHQICAYFGLIWDDAEEITRLATLSHPKVTIDTSSLSARATELANRLAERIGDLDDPRIEALLAELEDASEDPGPRY
jgi:transcriptional regulator with XRE-family HTH domain